MSVVKADTDWVFTRYESVWKVLPAAKFPTGFEYSVVLSGVPDRSDVFLLGALDVLNVGDPPILWGAPSFLEALLGNFGTKERR